jgi:subtilase family serine protease/5-hydroxyisourate hydrolase-like protein (transthyretin family)
MIGTGKFLIVRTSPGGLPDADESNNVAVSGPIDTLAPDLAVTSVTTVNAADVGESITFNWTVENVGSVPAFLFWQDQVFLSTDAVVDASDVLVGAVFSNSPVAAGGQYSRSIAFTIPNLPTGNYFVIVRAGGQPRFGGNPQQPDVNLSNNDRSFGPIQIGRPDLIVSDLQGPTSAVLGSSIPVTYTVTNVGDSSTGTGLFNDVFYISDDAVFSGDDVRVQIENIFAPTFLPLAANESYTRSINVALGSGSAGSKFLIVVTNAFGSQGEDDETNNARAIPIELTVPNLTVEDLSAPTVAAIGQTINISYTVTNTSSEPANGDWTDTIEIIRQNQSAVTLRSLPISSQTPLGAGQSYTINTTAVIPNFLPTGSYSLRVTTNAFQIFTPTQPESSFLDNSVAAPLELVLQSVDLRPTVVTAPPVITAGVSFDVAWTVINQGTQSAITGWSDSIFLSDDTVLDRLFDLRLRSVNAPDVLPLGASATYSRTASLVLANAGSGARFLIIDVDSFSQLAENDETNNVIVIPITIQGPDLVVDSVSTVAAGTFGSPFDVTYTVQNVGDSATNPSSWIDRLAVLNDQGQIVYQQNLAVDGIELTPQQSYSRTVSINVPALFPSGIYTVAITVNVELNQPETIFGNNVGVAAPISFTLPPVPDLVVSDFVLPIEGFSSQEYFASWTTTNAGDASAVGPWVDRLRWVSGLNVIELGNFVQNLSLGVGEIFTRSELLPLPTLPGAWNLEVISDALGAVAEGLNEQNRFISQDTVQVSPLPLPDLVVESVTAPPDGVFTGQNVSVSFVVRNIGNAATQPGTWFDYVLLSPTPNLTYDGGNDAFIITQLFHAVPFENPASLAPGEAYTQTVNLSLLQDVPGTWYVYVASDGLGYRFRPSQQVREISEANNFGRSAAFEVAQAPTPDLVVDDIQAQANAFSGQNIVVGWDVSNIGGGPTRANEWIDRVYLSTDETLDPSDIPIGRSPVSTPVLAGQGYSASAVVQLPINLSGSYFLIVAADDEDSVFESLDEGNNTLAQAINILLTPPPDLESTVTAAPAVASIGGTISITYRVDNFGATPTVAGLWSDAVYFSSDDVFDAGDVLLGKINHFGDLGVGDGYLASQSVTLPTSFLGSGFLFVVADSDDDVFELDNVNNAVARPITLVNEPPDLTFTGLLVPPTSNAGQIVNVVWNVTNAGLSGTGAATWTDRVYLSTDNVLDASDVELGEATFSNIDAGAGYGRQQLVTLPIVPAGEYFVIVALDNDGELFEANETNNVLASAITVGLVAADLVVASTNVPTTLTSGSVFSTGWTVTNQGSVPVGADYWYDDIFLSTDAQLNPSTDLFLGSRLRSGQLGAGASYNAVQDVTIPISVSGGNYFVLIRTDRNVPRYLGDPNVNRVFEGSQENNNLAAVPVQVVDGPTPDLSVISVSAPQVGYAGQLMTVEWTVQNVGAASASAFFGWRDGIYLSSDQLFDPTRDRFIGSLDRTGELLPGASYSSSLSVTIPSNFAGPAYVYVYTDATQAIFERGSEANNVGYDLASTNITVAPPVDLVVGTIDIPSTALIGVNATISFTVNNESGNTAFGSWFDSVFLSTDDVWDLNDALLARVLHTGDVAGGTGYTQTIQVEIPGVDPGSYRIIVRTDIRNSIAESDETNNISATLNGVSIDVPTLTLGQVATGSLLAGQSDFYKVVVPAGQTLRIEAVSESPFAVLDLFTRFGRVPTRSQFDRMQAEPFVSDPEIVFGTEAGTYYIQVFSSTTDASGDYAILAELIPFSIRRVEQATVGNVGEVTLRVEGSLFTSSTEFTLKSASDSVLASDVILVDSSLAFVTFRTSGLPAGDYLLEAKDGSTTSTSPVVVQQAIGANLVTSLTGPDLVRTYIPPATYTMSVNYSNRGDVNQSPPLFFVRSTTQTRIGRGLSDLSVDGLPLLGIGSEGPMGALRPGLDERLDVLFEVAGFANAFNLSVVQPDNTDVITDEEWLDLRLTFRPREISSPEWNSRFNQWQPRLGTTWSELIAILTSLAVDLSPTDKPIADVRDIFRRLLAEGPTANPTSILAGHVLDSVSGLPVAGVEVAAIVQEFGRNVAVARATTDIDGRFSFGSLPAGDYTLSFASEYAPDDNRDGDVDATQVSYTVTRASDTEVTTYVLSPTPREIRNDDRNAQLVTDAEGVTHVFFTRFGEIWHAYYNGADWVGAQRIPEAKGSDFSVQAGSRLIDGSQAGLVASWSIPNDDNDGSTIVYAVGVRLDGGGYEWSIPNLLTNDPLNNAAPAVIVADDGTLLVVYQKYAGADDDSDLYFNALQLTSDDLTFVGAINAIQQLQQLALEQATQAVADAGTDANIGPYELNLEIPKARIPGQISKYFPEVIGKFKASVKGNRGKTIDLQATVEIELTLEPAKNIKGFRLVADTEGRVRVNASYKGLWNTNGDKCEYELQYAQIAGGGGGGVAAIIPLEEFILSSNPVLAANPGTLLVRNLLYRKLRENGTYKADVKIGLDSFLQVRGEWNDKEKEAPPVVGRNPDKGELNAQFDATLSLVAKLVKWEVSLEGKLTTNMDLWPDLQLHGVTGTVTLKINLDGFIADLILVNESFGQSSGTPSLSGAIQADEDNISIEFDPSSTIGTTSTYFDGENDSVLSDVGTDLFDDSGAQLYKSPTGEIYAVWTKVSDTSEIGSRVMVATYNGTGWSTPIAIAGSLGLLGTPVIAADTSGASMIVWSSTDTSGFVPGITQQQFLDLVSTSQLYYSRFDSGSWTTAALVSPGVGIETNAELALGADGRLVLAWTRSTLDENEATSLLVSEWDGTSWTAPIVVATGPNIASPALGIVGGLTTLFWTQQLQLGFVSSSTDLYFSSFNGNWSDPTLFTPELATLGLINFTSSTDDGDGTINSGAANSLFGPPPDECCDDDDDNNNNNNNNNNSNNGDGGAYNPPTGNGKDPNDILGPVGFGDEQWISADRPLQYTIRFENVADATAPAQTVVIEQQLDGDLDFRTFRINSISIGNTRVDLPGTQPFFSGRIDLRETRGLFVDVTASVNVSTGKVRWQFDSVDPETGDRPLDANAGFLPPNEDGLGQGFVTYSIRAKNDVQTGDRIDAIATIVFDIELPIDTPAIFNTLDVEDPTSQVLALPSAVGPEFLVQWEGNDPGAGSALASFDIYVSKNGNAFFLWLEDTSLREALYRGDVGATYAFYSVARDNAGNVEAVPLTPDANTEVALTPAVAVQGPAESLVYKEAAFTVTATNVQPLPNNRFGFLFDWNNDGQFDQLVVAENGVTVTHVFESLGLQTVRVAIAGPNDEILAETTLQIEVVPFAVVVNQDDPTLSDLQLSGSDGDDSFFLEQLSETTIRVTTLKLNGQELDAPPVTFTGITGIVQVFAGGGNDVIDATGITTKGASLVGGDGDDTILGGNGENFIDADGPEGKGNDFVQGGDNNDIIYGDGQKGYDPQGVAGRDTLNGGEGDDILYGDGAEGSSSDVIDGGAGNDTIRGNGVKPIKDDGIYGSDTITGGVGDDVIIKDGAEGAGDSVSAGDGDDLVMGGRANDTIFGGSDNDVIFAGAGADSVDGEAGSDLIVAGRTSGTTLADAQAIQAEWTSGRPLADRVDNILGVGVGPRSNGDVFLVPGSNVLNDGAVDTILGGEDADWILASVGSDIVGDLNPDDVFSEV